MFILLDSTSLIVFEKLQLNRLNDKTRIYSAVIIDINMWFISRCISADSLNSCFPQQKNRMSYDFGLLKEGANPFRTR